MSVIESRHGQEMCTLLIVVDVYPGGSGIPAVLGLEVGLVFRSSTHCGGGGGEELAATSITKLSS